MTSTLRIAKHFIWLKIKELWLVWVLVALIVLNGMILPKVFTHAAYFPSCMHEVNTRCMFRYTDSLFVDDICYYALSELAIACLVLASVAFIVLARAFLVGNLKKAAELAEEEEKRGRGNK